MFLTLPTPFRRRRASGWREADAAALAVADVTSIHLQSHTVRAVVDETQRAYGGPEGVQAELSRRLAATPREAERTARTLDWARRALGEVSPE